MRIKGEMGIEYRVYNGIINKKRIIIKSQKKITFPFYLAAQKNK